MYIYMHFVCDGTCGAPKGALSPLELELHGSRELPCKCWELNLVPLQEQQILNG